MIFLMSPYYPETFIFFTNLLKHEIVYKYKGYIFGAEHFAPKGVNLSEHLKVNQRTVFPLKHQMV